MVREYLGHGNWKGNTHTGGASGVMGNAQHLPASTDTVIHRYGIIYAVPNTAIRKDGRLRKDWVRLSAVIGYDGIAA